MECPLEPEESECCNSGCNPCIFDVYEQQLKRYKQWQETQQSMKENCLKPLKYVHFTLVNIIPHTKDTNIYIFECPPSPVNANTNEQVIYDPGQHLLIKMKSHVDHNDFTRAYTPIPWKDLTARQFAVLVKLYPSGDMSACIKRLQMGDDTEWRGPYGDYVVDFKEKNILMIAQGTGIAPIYAVIKRILENEDCETRIMLIYCCKSLEVVHLRNELYSLLDYWNFNFELYLSQHKKVPSNQFKYKEKVNEKRLQEEEIVKILKDENWSSILLCGSDLITNYFKDIIKKHVNISVHCF